jgi:hypothetical protein
MMALFVMFLSYEDFKSLKQPKNICKINSQKKEPQALSKIFLWKTTKTLPKFGVLIKLDYAAAF